MFQHTNRILKKNGLFRPTLVVLASRVQRNILRLASKAKADNVELRPHFKTHQSVEIGQWFVEAGIKRITVSSVEMAEKFAAAGWTDITLAFLLNPLELHSISALAKTLASRGGRLGITLDSAAAAKAITSEIPVDIWLKIDTGYHRTGIPWDHSHLLRAVVDHLPRAPHGLLTHAGHSYHTHGAPSLRAIWAETLRRMQSARSILGNPELLLSVGDTPTCSVVESFQGVDEIRPGNFCYYDLMQLKIGSCSANDLAAGVACPVVGLYPERSQIVIHGGSVHLAKEHLEEHGRTIYGKLGYLDPGRVVDEAVLTDLSQEHGTVTFLGDTFPRPDQLAIGDLVLVWPVHSCLAANLNLPPRVLPNTK